MALNQPVKRIGSLPLNERALKDAFKAKATGTGYTGAGDPLLNFGKASSFVGENQSGKVFTMTINNAGATDINICLNQGLHALETGAVAIADGIVTTDVTAGGRPSSIAKFLAYIKNNPTRIKGIQLQVSDEAQLANSIRYVEIDAFKAKDSEEERVPTNYQNPSDSNTKLVEISDIDSWLFSDHSQMYMLVGAGYSVTLTFVCGASLDNAKGLNAKADEAAYNVSLVASR